MMNLQEQTLSGDIIYQTKLHWISYAKPLFLIVIGIPFLISLFFIEKWFLLVLYGIIGLQALKGLYIYFFLKRLKIVLTSRFLSLKTGVFTSKISDLSLSKVEAIDVSQGIFGRILNYGRLTITTGEITHTYLIQNPMEFRQYLLQDISNKV